MDRQSVLLRIASLRAARCGVEASRGARGCLRTLPARSAAAWEGLRGRRFVRDRDGAAAVEFALIAFPSLATVVAVLVIGLYGLFTASLDHAVLVTARAIATGAVSPSGMSGADLKTGVVCPALVSGMNCDSVFVKVTTLPSGQYPSTYYSLVKSDQSGLVQPALSASQNAFCPGGAAQYVVVQLAYPMPVLASFLKGVAATTFGGNAVNVIVSSATFLSEPYSGASSYSGC